MSTPTIEAVDLKECGWCHEHKPTSEFNRRNASPDGLQYFCRPCGNAASAEYRIAHPEANWESNYRARAHAYGNAAVVFPFTKAELIDYYGDECWTCGNPFTELDHNVPVAAGGWHSKENCRPSCTNCNRTDAYPAKVAKAKREADIAATRARQKALENAAAIASQSAIFSA